jgi:spermidine synthase
MTDFSDQSIDNYTSCWDTLIDGRENASICDVDGLSASDIRFLGRLGLWPQRFDHNSVEPGSPYVSDMGKYRSLHFDWNSVQSEMNREDPLALTIDYTRMMMAFLLFNPNPARIEMIGLGGGSLAKLCYHLLPNSEITVIEINREVIALREEFLIPPDNDRFRIVCGNGADYVRESRAMPDVLLIDGFDACGQPPELCSSLFYDHCHQRLVAAGMMIVNLWGGDAHNRNHAAKMRRRFRGDVLMVPTEGGINQAILARKEAPISLSKSQIAYAHARFQQRQAAFLPSIGKRISWELDRRDI